MKIEQAKDIPIVSLLEKLGLKPDRQKNTDVWYRSPLRSERTASFKVHSKKNVWYDFGEGKGGDIIAFACAFLEANKEAHTVSDALRWIENLSGKPPGIRFIPDIEVPEKSSTLTLKKTQPIQHRLLINYLDKRGISLSIAQKYLKQLRIYNIETKKHFFALGFPNEEEGFEVRNPFFKGCLGTKAITFIRGTVPKPHSIHLFEGMMDYLSVLECKRTSQLQEDAIILNSLSIVQTAMPYIKSYGYAIAYTWLDNDPAGDKASKTLAAFFKTEADLQHKPMNAVYQPHKDVNAWHMQKPRL